MDLGYSFWLLLTKIHGFGALLRLRNESGLDISFKYSPPSPRFFIYLTPQAHNDMITSMSTIGLTGGIVTVSRDRHAVIMRYEGMRYTDIYSNRNKSWPIVYMISHEDRSKYLSRTAFMYII